MKIFGIPITMEYTDVVQVSDRVFNISVEAKTERQAIGMWKERVKEKFDELRNAPELAARFREYMRGTDEQQAD